MNKPAVVTVGLFIFIMYGFINFATQLKNNSYEKTTCYSNHDADEHRWFCPAW